MNTLTQKLRFRQSVVLFSFRNSVLSAIRRFGVSRATIYRWRKMYDGSLNSLAERSRRPHSHPNQHTPEELKLISDMRKRNPNAGLVVFWVKLMQRGYKRTIPVFPSTLSNHVIIVFGQIELRWRISTERSKP